MCILFFDNHFQRFMIGASLIKPTSLTIYLHINATLIPCSPTEQASNDFHGAIVPESPINPVSVIAACRLGVACQEIARIDLSNASNHYFV